MTRPSLLYRLLATVSFPVEYGIFRLDAVGTANVPEGGFVLAANHVSNFDPWPLGLALYPRFLRFMAKAELFWWPLGLLVKAGGAFKVRRGMADKDAIEAAVGLVKDGEIVVMFPEGTRQKKGLVKKFQPRAHTGAARIAWEAGAPLVPAAIKGTDQLLRVAKLRVAFGEPIEAVEDVQATTERLMDEIRRLYDTL